MHGLNWYDFLARMYDPHIGRFLTIDPLCEKYYGISPYAYCGNNPINRIDPTGMDWYWINYDDKKNRSLQYDPNVTKDSQLGENQRYAGATLKYGTGTYREDGSIMFSKESDGYSRIWNNSQLTGNEEMGVITDNGVLVLPSYKNDESTATPENYGYSWADGNIQDADGNSFNTLGTVHTHPNPNGDGTASLEDTRYFSANAPNKPYLIFMPNLNVASYMSYPLNSSGAGVYSGLELPNYNGISPTHVGGLVFGRYPLIQTFKQNKRR